MCVRVYVSEWKRKDTEQEKKFGVQEPTPM